MDNKLNFWQKLVADLGRPNINGGSNYSDPELRYYLRNITSEFNDFIPTPVLRDAWRGAYTRFAQPMSGGMNYPDNDMLNDMVREAIRTRLDMRSINNATSPTGANIDKMWGSTLSPTDAILNQAKVGLQQGSGTGDYYPPIE